MVNKRVALRQLNEYGDAIVDFVGGKEPVLVTTDFSTPYIRKVRRMERFQLKGKILVFDWTNDKFDALGAKEIKYITPLAKVLNNPPKEDK